MKFVITCVLVAGSQFVLAQQKKPVTIYMGVEYTATEKDATKPNNPTGFGTFITLYGNTGKIQPVFDLAGDAFFPDDKVQRLGPADEPLPRINGLWSMMGGVAIHPGQRLSAGFLTGPAFLDGNALWAIKPFLGVIPGKKGSVLLRLNYLQTGKRIASSNVKHYSAFTFGIGFRLLGSDLH